VHAKTSTVFVENTDVQAGLAAVGVEYAQKLGMHKPEWMG
jgi:hypothetical protein